MTIISCVSNVGTLSLRGTDTNERRLVMLCRIYQRNPNRLQRTSVEGRRPKGLKAVVSIGRQPDKVAPQVKKPVERYRVDGMGR